MKKKLMDCIHNGGCIKLFRIMKLTIFFLLPAFLAISAEGYSQSQRLSIKMKDARIVDILTSIEEQSEFYFFYKNDEVAGLTKANVQFEDATIDKVLSEVLENTGLGYRIVDKYIVISPAGKTGMAKQAGTKRMQGKVTDPSGAALPGVTIVIKGTQQGTVSNSGGYYSLANVPGDATLVFSFIGMKSEEIQVEDKAVVNVTMEEETVGLEEVVAVGYGTVKKSDLTGSVASIKKEELLRISPTSINQGLQGRIAGVQVNQNDGAPGAGVSITIRGANSFTTSSEPLYIVDGIPYSTAGTPTSGQVITSGMLQTTNPLALLNPQDIESIEVLKDASATAIYGSRGANGVVLITTKRGEKGKENITVSTNFSISNVIKKIEVLDAHDYASYMNEQKIMQSNYEGTPLGELPYPGISKINPSTGETVYYPGPDDYLTGEYPSTNWQDQIFQQAFSKEYNVALDGANDKGYYAISGNILDQTGTIYNSGFDRYTFRANVARKVHEWIEIGTNMSFTNSVTKLAKTNSTDNSVIRSALYFLPTRPLMDATNDAQVSWFAANPYIFLRESKDELTTNNFFSSSFLQVSPVKGLRIRQNVGFSSNQNSRNMYYSRKTNEGKDPTNGFASQSDTWARNVAFESTASYEKSFNENNYLNAMGAFTYEDSQYGNKGMSATGFPNDITGEYKMSAGTNQNLPVSSRGENSLVSFLGRINYTLMNRYLFTASYRRDGSSKFARKNRWSDFSSYAIAWRASEENFIKELNIFGNLKLRFSYGETGNQGIGAYAVRDRLDPANYPINGTLNSGFANIVWAGPANPDLKWETTQQYDSGIDLSFKNNKISFTVDFYHKKTSDLLQQVQIPSVSGFNIMMANSANVINKGFEVSAQFLVLKQNSFSWDIDANISLNRNKISGLKDDQYATKLWTGADQVFLQRNGEPIGIIYGYVEDGFYDNEAEVRADPYYAAESDAVVKAMIGEIKYRNFDDDPAINDHDRQIIGDVNPDYIFGVNQNFKYKNFSFGMFIQGCMGGDIFNGNLSEVKMMSMGNLPQFIYDSRWTPENRENAGWPKAYGGFNRRVLLSDRYVEDGSYLRLKNINLSYKIKYPLKGIEYINISTSVSNVFTISDYRWYDPDVNSFGGDASRRGVDVFAYPSSRTFTFGIQCAL